MAIPESFIPGISGLGGWYEAIAFSNIMDIVDGETPPFQKKRYDQTGHSFEPHHFPECLNLCREVASKGGITATDYININIGQLRGRFKIRTYFCVQGTGF